MVITMTSCSQCDRDFNSEEEIRVLFGFYLCRPDVNPECVLEFADQNTSVDYAEEKEEDEE